MQHSQIDRSQVKQTTNLTRLVACVATVELISRIIKLEDCKNNATSRITLCYDVKIVKDDMFHISAE